ncbi:MAG: alpha/beta hydrolase [Pirellulaceae bacterium]|jgi:pimeloyl-ACP methyl ester carboxylesterase|nr:alpha/beta hydrolase [Pirellulaceae bacterium]
MNEQLAIPQRGQRRWPVAGVGLLVAIALGVPPQVTAQAPPRKPAAKSEEKSSEDVTLTTKDGVILHATYYPGPEKKNTVPLILLHDFGGTRTDLHTLAVWLQQTLNHTVLVPDLRGHGTSDRQQGVDAPLDIDKMARPALEKMWQDVEAAKTYLLHRHNEGKLNIEQLGVLGTGYGAMLALKWAIKDWTVADLPTYKMGRDVKALILVSPMHTFKGVSIANELKIRNVLAQVSVLTVVGQQDTRLYGDAKRVIKAFEQAHRDDAEKTVIFLEADSPRQGIDLIYDRDLPTAAYIRDFIQYRLVQREAEFPWVDRTSPLK